MFRKGLALLGLLVLPVFSLAVGYSSIFGGMDSEGTDGTAIMDIAVDSAGYVYVCGYTISTNMPVTPGAYQSTNKNTNPYDYIGDGFVAKLDETLTNVIFCTYIGGSGGEVLQSIKLDKDGNIYVGGYTNSSDFPVTSGVLQAAKSSDGGNNDGFVFKLNSTGTALLYSTYLGGNNEDVINKIAIDTAGNVYVAGDTLSTNLPVTGTAKQKTNGGGRDAFVGKINATGTALSYLTYLGGNSYEYANGLALDTQGNAYVCGVAYSTNFPITASAKQKVLSGSGTSDAFVTKVNPTGTDWVYSTFIGGNGYDMGQDIAIDSAGFAYLLGKTNSTNYPVTAGAPQTTMNGIYDMCITKINQDGSNWVYSTYLGGDQEEYPYAINVNSAGQAYIVGYSYSTTTYSITSGAYQVIPNSYAPGTLTILNATGTDWVYSTYINGSFNSYPIKITFDSNDTPYLAGSAYNADFPVTPNAFDKVVDTSNGSGFVMRFELPFVPVELSGFSLE